RDEGDLQRRRRHPLRHRRRDAGRDAHHRRGQGVVPRHPLRRRDPLMAHIDPQHPNVISRLEGKKAIRAFARKLEEPEVIKDLNITPMMDMMTIILVFLLKSFTSSASTITFDQNLQIPKSDTPLKQKIAIAVTITKKV